MRIAAESMNALSVRKGRFRGAVVFVLTVVPLLLNPRIGKAQTPAFAEDFQSYPATQRPSGWLDSKPGSLTVETQSTFGTAIDPLDPSNIVYGAGPIPVTTAVNSGSPRFGFFSTYAKATFSSAHLEYRGRFIRMTENDRPGLTVFSELPDRDNYYLISLSRGDESHQDDAGRPIDRTDVHANDETLRLSAWGSNAPGGTTDSHFTPETGHWYRFLITVDLSMSGTLIRGRFWRDGENEPSEFSIISTDVDPHRPTSGKIGVWSARLEGRRHAIGAVESHSGVWFDDLSVTTGPVTDTAPRIVLLVSGRPFVDGSAFSRSVSVVISVTDDHPGSTFVAALDGAPYTSGVAIGAEGSHLLTVQAVDSVGNHADTAIHFLIDKTPPIITFLEGGNPLPDGETFNRAVTISASIADASTFTSTLLLDGSPYTAGTSILTSGVHRANVTAVDALGNTSSASVHFTIDLAAPQVIILANGVPLDDGAFFNTNVVLTVSASASLPVTTEATLDGGPLTPPAQVSGESLHSVSATATDSAGNSASTGTLHFTIDKTPPAVTILANGSPLVSGSTFDDDVVITLATTDATPTTVALQVDGESYIPGVAITADGGHTLTGNVADDAGNHTDLGNVDFRISRTVDVPPVLSGIKPIDGSVVTVPEVTISGDGGSAAAVTVNGVTAVMSGTHFVAVINLTEGSNRITIVGTNGAGDSATVTLDLILDSLAPALTVDSPAGGCVDANSLMFAGSVGDRSVAGVRVDLLDGSTVARFDATLDATRSHWSVSIPFPLEGTFNARITASDDVGHQTTTSVGLMIDRTSPVIVITDHGLAMAALYRRSVTPFVSVTDADPNVRVTSTLDGQPFLPGGAISSEGQHVFSVTAADCAGHVSEVSRPFTIDTTPPSFGPFSPANGSTVSTTPAVIQGSVSEGASSVEVVGTTVHVVTAGDGSFSASTLSLAEGENHFSFKATDPAGNQSVADYLLTIHSTAPTIEILEGGFRLSDGALFNHPIHPTASVSDPAAASRMTLDGVPFSPGSAIVQDGLHQVAATATDAFGHLSSASASFTIDQTAPIVRITSPLQGAQVSSPPVTVTGTSGDAETVTVNGVAAVIATGSFSVQLAMEDGEQRIVAAGRDHAGNTGTDAVVVTIGSEAPGLVLSSPADGSLTNRPAAVVSGRLLTAGIVPSVVISTRGVSSPPAPATVGVDPSGGFRLVGYPLVQGANAIVATATTASGISVSATVHVAVDLVPPSLLLMESGHPLAEGARITGSANISIVASDDSGSVATTLTVDGAAEIGTSALVSGVGGHDVVAVADDAAGNQTRVERTFVVTDGTGSVSTSCDISGLDPADGSVVTSAEVTLVGRTTAAGLLVGTSPAAIVGGSFRAPVELTQEGDNPVTLSCTDGGVPVGEPTTIHFLRVTGAPSISILSPADLALTGVATIQVSGTVSADAFTVDVNGVNATIASDHSFTISITLASGLNVIVARARNAAGATAVASRRVIYLSASPAISITAPISPAVSGSPTVHISGTWLNLDPSTLAGSTGGARFSLALGTASETAGSFSGDAPLAPGVNVVTIDGEDSLNRATSASVIVTLTPGAPSIDILSPADNSYLPQSAASVAVAGSFTAAAGANVEVNGVPATVSVNNFSAAVPLGSGGVNPIVARVTEPAGSSAVAIVKVSKLPAFAIKEIFPADGATDVDPAAIVLVLFSSAINVATVSTDTIRIEDASGDPLPGTYRVDRDVVSFAPSVPFAAGGHNTIHILPALQDLAGQSLAVSVTAAFDVASTGAGPPPVLDSVSSPLCSAVVQITGRTTAGSHLHLESGALVLDGLADAGGHFSLTLPLSGEAGFRDVRVRTVSADGTMSPAAEVSFDVDCSGPAVLSATFDGARDLLTILFSRPIDPATVVSGSSLLIQTEDGAAIPAAIVFTDRMTAVVMPASDLSVTTFTLTLTSDVVDSSGRHLDPFTQSFVSDGGSPADGNGSISGEIYDAGTGRPLPGARVSIDVPLEAFSRTDRSTGGSASSEARGNQKKAQPVSAATVVRALSLIRSTDSRGRYSLRLPEGAYTIHVSAASHTAAWRQVVVRAGTGVVPIDIRLTPLGSSSKTQASGDLSLDHGGDSAITRHVTLFVPAGAEPPGVDLSLTALGAQGLAGLLPLGWSPVASAEVRLSAPPTFVSLTFDVPSTDISGADQTLTAVRYDASRDEWLVLASPVSYDGGTSTVQLRSSEFLSDDDGVSIASVALVVPDHGGSIASPPAPKTGDTIQGVADSCAAGCSLTAVSFDLDPAVISPSGRTTASLRIDGTSPPFPSGTAVEASIDEDLTLADGSHVLDPPFAADLILYRSLDGSQGAADFSLAPSASAQKVSLSSGVNHIRVLPYPGRLDRGTLIGAEGGEVPGDGGLAVEIPTGATTDELHASASLLDSTALQALGTLNGYRVVAGMNLAMSSASGSTSAVTLLKPARATFTIDRNSLTAPDVQLVLAEVDEDPVFGRVFRLSDRIAVLDPEAMRVTTTPIDSTLPLDGIVREGTYLLLAAQQPMAYATGSVRSGEVYLSGVRVSTFDSSSVPLAVEDVSRLTGLFAIPVIAAPAPPFSLVPATSGAGTGASYVHSSSPAANSVVSVGDLNFAPQPPVVQSTVPADGATSVSLTTNVQVRFSKAIDPSSVMPASIQVTGEDGSTISGSVAADSTGIVFTITPGSSLAPGLRYVVSVSPSVRGANGAVLGTRFQFTFTTVQELSDGQVRPDLVRITIQQSGISMVLGGAGAIPSGWQLHPIRRGRAFITQFQAVADETGAFSLTIGACESGSSCGDAVSLTDLIDLAVINSVGNLAAIIPLTPFVTADGHGFIASQSGETRFVSPEGYGITVPADAFPTPTLVTLNQAPANPLAAVPDVTNELTMHGAVQIAFDCNPSAEPAVVSTPCVAGDRLQISLNAGTPTPDPSKQYLLGLLGESVRGSRVMIVDKLSLARGQFTTEDQQSANASTDSRGAARRARGGGSSRSTPEAQTTSPQAMSDDPIKEALPGVADPGTYAAVDLTSPYTWVSFSDVPGVDLFWDVLTALYISHTYAESHAGTVVVPIPSDQSFQVVGVDPSSGLESFSHLYGPVVPGDPGVSVVLPSPSAPVAGPYPVFATPARVELADIEADDTPITSISNFVITESHAIASVTDSDNPLDPSVNVTLFNPSTGAEASRPSPLSVAAHAGDRLVLIAGAADVDSGTPISVVFDQPIYTGDSPATADVDDFLHDVIDFSDVIRDSGGAEVSSTDLNRWVTYSVDSGSRRVLITYEGRLKPGERYRISLRPALAGISGDGHEGLRLGQFVSGSTTSPALATDLTLDFDIRDVGPALSSFNLTAGGIRDMALQGSLLFISALDGGLVALDVSDPSALSTAVPIASVAAGTDQNWAVASDHHGRVFATTLGPSFGTVQSYRIEDFLAAASTPERLVAGSRASALVCWNPAANTDSGDGDPTISGRPAGIPRKLQILLQDDDQEFDSRAAFGAANPVTVTSTLDGNYSQMTATIPISDGNPYRIQQITITNASLGLSWSGSATAGSPATIAGIIAGPSDQIHVIRNRFTYGVLTVFGFGLQLLDLNALEANADPTRPAGYVPLQVIVREIHGELPGECGATTDGTAAIPDLGLSPDGAILTRTGASTLGIFGLDIHRGVLDLSIDPSASVPDLCSERAPQGLLFHSDYIADGGPASYDDPRLAKLRTAYAARAGRPPEGRFTGIDTAHWSISTNDNLPLRAPKPGERTAPGARGSLAGEAVDRGYLLVAGGEYGLLIVEAGGTHLPKSAPVSSPLGPQHLADVIWSSAGIYAVRAIPGTNLATAVDGDGRLLLVDLSTIDERFDSDGDPIAIDALFPSISRSLAGVSDGGVGADDPRILWASEAGLVSGAMAPIVDIGSGLLYAGELLGQKTTVIPIFDPKMQLMINLGSGAGLSSPASAKGVPATRRSVVSGPSNVTPPQPKREIGH